MGFTYVFSSELGALRSAWCAANADSVLSVEHLEQAAVAGNGLGNNVMKRDLELACVYSLVWESSALLLFWKMANGNKIMVESSLFGDKLKIYQKPPVIPTSKMCIATCRVSAALQSHTNKHLLDTTGNLLDGPLEELVQRRLLLLGRRRCFRDHARSHQGPGVVQTCLQAILSSSRTL
jgi:hypothetical protein